MDNECEITEISNRAVSVNDNNNVCNTEITNWDNTVPDSTEACDNIDFTDAKITYNTSKTKTPWQQLNTLDGVSNIDLSKTL